MGVREGQTIIDTNCYLGNWPTRKLGVTSAEGLAKLAAENGVTTCMVSPLDAIFHKDRVSANSNLIKELARWKDGLRPLPIINPLSPVDETGDFRLLRMTPTHHGYSPLNRTVLHFLSGLETGGSVLFMSMRMRDERLIHPMLKTRPVSPDGLISALRRFPALRVIINNARSTEMRRILERTGDRVLLGCDWSLPIGFVERMVGEHGDHRIVFGSNSPLHYYQSSLLQVQEADLPERSRRRILCENAAALLGETIPGSRGASS